MLNHSGKSLLSQTYTYPTGHGDRLAGLQDAVTRPLEDLGPGVHVELGAGLVAPILVDRQAGVLTLIGRPEVANIQHRGRAVVAGVVANVAVSRLDFGTARNSLCHFTGLRWSARVFVGAKFELDGGRRDALGGAGQANPAAGHLARLVGVVEDEGLMAAHLHAGPHLDNV